jgi:hypothetical protein
MPSGYAYVRHLSGALESLVRRATFPVAPRTHARQAENESCSPDKLLWLSSGDGADRYCQTRSHADLVTVLRRPATQSVGEEGCELAMRSPDLGDLRPIFQCPDRQNGFRTMSAMIAANSAAAMTKRRPA